MTRHLTRAAVLTVLVAIPVMHGCSNPDSFQTVVVSLKSTDTFHYPTVGGDEEGARIATQAKYYRISEIRRDAATNWVATYVYQPAAGFVGSDHAEIEVLTGSDGASPPTHVQRIAFQFTIRD